MKKKEFRRILCIFMCVCTLFLSSCGTVKAFFDRNKLQIESKKITFQNLSYEYSISPGTLETFFLDGQNLPYVSVWDFITVLEGFLNTDGIVAHLFETLNQYNLLWYSADGAGYRFVADWETDRIFVNDIGFFYHTCEMQETAYHAFSNVMDVSSSGEKNVTFELGKYGFDIVRYKEWILVPFHVLNTLFCSLNGYNVFFNGEAYYGVRYHGDGNSKEELQLIRSSSLKGTTCPADMREATLNHLCFVMDYFYGLKEDKEIENFKSVITGNDMNLFLSEDPSAYEKAYVNIFQKKLDELHTNIAGPSFYHPENAIIDIYAEENAGDFWKKYSAVERQLGEQAAERWKDAQPRAVRYVDDTAIITLYSFDVGSKYDVYNGNVLQEDAWKYDSYFFMRRAMKEIESRGNISHIVLDLSRNGGGYIDAMINVLGFLTDSPIEVATYNCLTNELQKTHYEVDIDGDGIYKDDAYDGYEWYLLTSVNSFSAASSFTAIAKKMEIATVIGQQTGGGMCSVFYTVLVDGTPIRISSNNSYRIVENREGQDVYYSIEHGIKPHHELDYERFYSDDLYLDSFIDSIK